MLRRIPLHSLPAAGNRHPSVQTQIRTRSAVYTPDDLVSPTLFAPLPRRARPCSTAGGGSEYVQGLTYKECATLLNVDVNNHELMEEIYDTAYNIKERIYGNRIVLFAPLYIANYCVNNCAYCAFRSVNKDIEVRAPPGAPSSTTPSPGLRAPLAPQPSPVRRLSRARSRTPRTRSLSRAPFGASGARPATTAGTSRRSPFVAAVPRPLRVYNVGDRRSGHV